MNSLQLLVKHLIVLLQLHLSFSNCKASFFNQVPDLFVLSKVERVELKLIGFLNIVKFLCFSLEGTHFDQALVSFLSFVSLIDALLPIGFEVSNFLSVGFLHILDLFKNLLLGLSDGFFVHGDLTYPIFKGLRRRGFLVLNFTLFLEDVFTLIIIDFLEVVDS